MWVPTLEGTLIKEWREVLGVTQAALGDACSPKKLSNKRISDIESRDNSMGVDSLLVLIRALERAGRTRLGTTDRLRLSNFFAGPDLTDARAAKAKADRDVREMEGATRE